MNIKNKTKEVELVYDIFQKYNKLLTVKKPVVQALTAKYSDTKVQGNGKGKTPFDTILENCNETPFVMAVNDILRVMPSTYKKILINRFVREWEHDDIIEKLGIDEDYIIARTTYFDWYKYAVDKFYREAIARMIESYL